MYSELNLQIYLGTQRGAQYYNSVCMHLEMSSSTPEATAENCQQDENALNSTFLLDLCTEAELVLKTSTSLLLSPTFLVYTAPFSQNTDGEKLFFFPLTVCEQTPPGVWQVWCYSLLL